jgi:hypothetical protein
MIESEFETEEEHKLQGKLYTYSPETEKRILDFINNAQEAKDISGIEHQEGPVFDNPITQKKRCGC